MSTPTAELLKSPRLPLYIEELKRALALEKTRRQRSSRDTREDQKAEFINGESIVNPPAPLEHISAERFFLGLLSAYVDSRDLGCLGHEKMMISLTRNDYEPDLCYFTKAKARRFKPSQTRFPAPDFIVEILSPSTAQTDRGVKFEDYAPRTASPNTGSSMPRRRPSSSICSSTASTASRSTGSRARCAAGRSRSWRFR